MNRYIIDIIQNHDESSVYQNQVYAEDLEQALIIATTQMREWGYTGCLNCIKQTNLGEIDE